MTKRTFQKLREFNVISQGYLLRCRMGTKIAYAIARVQEKYMSTIFKEYSEKVRTIAIEHCFVDGNGVILYDTVRGENGQESRKFRYTKEGMIKKEKDEKELMDEYDKKEVEIDTFIVKDVPLDLNEIEIEAFKGLVIPKDYEAKEVTNGQEEPVLKTVTE